MKKNVFLLLLLINVSCNDSFDNSMDDYMLMQEKTFNETYNQKIVDSNDSIISEKSENIYSQDTLTLRKAASYGAELESAYAYAY